VIIEGLVHGVLFTHRRHIRVRMQIANPDIDFIEVWSRPTNVRSLN
jgi:hypothetical protein